MVFWGYSKATVHEHRSPLFRVRPCSAHLLWNKVDECSAFFLIGDMNPAPNGIWTRDARRALSSQHLSPPCLDSLHNVALRPPELVAGACWRWTASGLEIAEARQAPSLSQDYLIGF